MPSDSEADPSPFPNLGGGGFHSASKSYTDDELALKSADQTSMPALLLVEIEGEPSLTLLGFGQQNGKWL